MDLKNLLITLASSEGVGYMDTVADIAAKQLSPFSKVTKTDNCLMAEFGEGDYTIMLEAHMDEVAMIVTEVFDDGFLSVAPVGSIDARLLPAQPVKIYGKQTVSGTFTSVPPHIKNEDSVPSFDTCKIDTGDMAIGEKVSQGDLVLFDAPAIELKNNRISSKALDNRAGMAAVIMAAKKIATQNPKSKVVLLFPTGEELGLRGARVSAYDIPADECIVVDVSFGDCMEVPASKTAKLGSGAMIGISPVLDKNIYNKLKRFTSRAEHVDDLVFYHFFHHCARVAKVLTGVKVTGEIVEVFTKCRRERYAQVGVDIDFADSHFSCLTEHIFWDTDCIWHMSAISVNDFDIFLCD